MADLILPASYGVGEGPIIFLAGPTRGAPKWHEQAIEYFLDKDVQIAAPLREIPKKLEEYLMYRGDKKGRQRIWERTFLDLAMQDGCVLFWLPGEIEHNCQKSYGAMTRYELAQVTTRYDLHNRYGVGKNVNFVLGTDVNFSEFRTIEVDLRRDAKDVPIYSSLEETCDAALSKICHNFM